MRNPEEMTEIRDLMKGFEERNNISIDICYFSDGSSVVREFWDEDNIKECKDINELVKFLTDGKLLMSDGRSVSPCKIISE